MVDCYVGEVRIFAGMYAPMGWHVCDGSTVSVSTYQALFALLGTTYGGDGVSTFGLPDLRGRLTVGTGLIQGGTNNYVRGQAAGTPAVSLAEANLPSHSHTVTASLDNASTPNPNGAYLAKTQNANLYIAQPTTATFAAMDPAVINNTGSNQQHANLMPYTVLNYIIAMNGQYPVPAQ